MLFHIPYFFIIVILYIKKDSNVFKYFFYNNIIFIFIIFNSIFNSIYNIFKYKILLIIYSIDGFKKKIFKIK